MTITEIFNFFLSFAKFKISLSFENLFQSFEIDLDQYIELSLRSNQTYLKLVEINLFAD